MNWRNSKVANLVYDTWFLWWSRIPSCTSHTSNWYCLKDVISLLSLLAYKWVYSKEDVVTWSMEAGLSCNCQSIVKITLSLVFFLLYLRHVEDEIPKSTSLLIGFPYYSSKSWEPSATLSWTSLISPIWWSSSTL